MTRHRARIAVNSTVVLRKSEDLSDRFEPCSSKPQKGWQPAGVRGTVVEIDNDPTNRPIQIHFPSTGVTAWFARSNVKVLPVDPRR